MPKKNSMSHYHPKKRFSLNLSRIQVMVILPVKYSMHRFYFTAMTITLHLKKIIVSLLSGLVFLQLQ